MGFSHRRQLPGLQEDPKEGNYKVLQDLKYTSINSIKISLPKNEIIFINKNHPLYKDVPKYLENNLIKKL